MNPQGAIQFPLKKICMFGIQVGDAGLFEGCAACLFPFAGRRKSVKEAYLGKLHHLTSIFEELDPKLPVLSAQLHVFRKSSNRQRIRFVPFSRFLCFGMQNLPRKQGYRRPILPP